MAAARPGPRLSRRTLIRAVGGSVVIVPWLTACSSTPSPNTVRIQYQQFGSGTVMQDFLTAAMQRVTAQRPEIVIELVPLVAAEADYFTKNELMMSSPNVTPDLVYEDTFILKSDVAAGYLRPMDEYVLGSEHWDDLTEPSKEAVTYDDGRVYAFPTHTDTRALWYHTGVLADAGIELPWEPRTWDDLLQTFRTIRQTLPEVIPFHIFSGEPQGEKASMQGFEMLLYGTGATLYDEQQTKWVIGSQGFIDSLDFLRTVFAEQLTTTVADALNPNIEETKNNTWLPTGQLGVSLDGSWISQNWVEGAAGAWPEWSETMQLARMPTQRGQDPGWVTLAGGWSWAMPRLSTRSDLAWTVLQEMMSTQSMVDLAVADNQVTIREDVRSDPAYLGYSPTIDFFTELGEMATYRPALAAYPEVSARIQEAMGAVMTGETPPEEAAARYDQAVIDLVGPDSTTRG